MLQENLKTDIFGGRAKQNLQYFDNLTNKLSQVNLEITIAWRLQRKKNRKINR